MRAELDRLDPFERLRGHRALIVADEAAEKGMEADSEIGVIVFDGRKRSMGIDFDAEFFAELAYQGLGGSFAGFAFAAGEFPQTGEGLVWLRVGRSESALGDEEFRWRR